MVVACRLAAERHASITVLAVIEIAPFLPLDAHMTEEEEDARRMAAQAQAIGDAYGVTVHRRTVRTREAAGAILGQAEADQSDLVVIGARRRERGSNQAPAFGGSVQHVLRKASCRVLIVATPIG